MNYLTYLLLIPVICTSCLSKNNQQDTISSEVEVEFGSVSKEVHMVGRIRSLNSILVRSPYRSQLVKLFVGLGAEVKKGQILAKISEPKNTNRLDKLIQAQGELRRVKLRKSQLSLRLKEKQKDLKSSKRLLASGSISKAEQDQAKVAFYLQKRELEILDAEELTIKESLKLIQSNQRNSFQTLKAPVDGVVTSLWVDEDKITEGMSIDKDTAMLKIEEPGTFVFVSDIPEPDYLKLLIGQKVQLKLSYDRTRAWYGKVSSLSPVAKPSGYGVGLFSIKVSFKSSDPKIRSGLEAIGKIIIHKSKKALRVPRASVKISDEGQYFVSVMSEEGIVDKRILPGLIGDNFIQVKKGLKQGSIILASYSGD